MHYMRYLQTRTSLSWMEHRHFANSSFVPGYIGDVSKKPDWGKGKFMRWYSRPRASHRLYWRLHK